MRGCIIGIRTLLMGLLAISIVLEASAARADDARSVAIQTLLDSAGRRPLAYDVINGKRCYPQITGHMVPERNPVSYRNVPGAHFSVDPPMHYSMGTQNCWTITWDKNTGIQRSTTIYGSWNVPIGKYIVDKIGDEQASAFGTRMTPYRAHFEATPLGQALINVHIVQRPADITDGQAYLHKDADGKLIAG